MNNRISTTLALTLLCLSQQPHTKTYTTNEMFGFLAVITYGAAVTAYVHNHDAYAKKLKPLEDLVQRAEDLNKQMETVVASPAASRAEIEAALAKSASTRVDLANAAKLLPKRPWFLSVPQESHGELLVSRATMCQLSITLNSALLENKINNPDSTQQ